MRLVRFKADKKNVCKVTSTSRFVDMYKLKYTKQEKTIGIEVDYKLTITIKREKSMRSVSNLIISMRCRVSHICIN